MSVDRSKMIANVTQDSFQLPRTAFLNRVCLSNQPALNPKDADPRQTSGHLCNRAAPINFRRKRFASRYHEPR